MKIIKYILIALAVLVIVFLAFGIFNKTVSYGHSIDVNVPVERAWDISQDEAYFNEWLEGFKSIELLTGEQGEPGSTYKVIVNPGEGQEDFEMIQTLVSRVENDHVFLRFDSDFMDFEQKILFAETGGGSTITTESKVIGKNLMTRSMFAVMEKLGGAFQSQEEKNMEALKTLINEKLAR